MLNKDVDALILEAVGGMLTRILADPHFRGTILIKKKYAFSRHSKRRQGKGRCLE